MQKKKKKKEKKVSLVARIAPRHGRFILEGKKNRKLFRDKGTRVRRRP